MKPLFLILFTAVLATPAHANAASAACGMANLQDVDVATTLVPIATVTTAREKGGKVGVRDWYAYSTPGARLSKRYLITVRLNDTVYTGEASGDGFWTFNPTTLVVNDTVHACVVKDRLHITRPDGKDYSTKVVRAIRDVRIADVGER